MKKLLGGFGVAAIVVAVWAGNAWWLQTRQAERVTDAAAAWWNGGEVAASVISANRVGASNSEPDLAPWYGGFFIGVAGLLLLASVARDSLSGER